MTVLKFSLILCLILSACGQIPQALTPKHVQGEYLSVPPTDGCANVGTITGITIDPAYNVYYDVLVKCERSTQIVIVKQ